jgi:hypothetical protein
MLSVFSKLGLNVLHMACEQREARKDEDIDNEESDIEELVPRKVSHFVIDKLLQVGADPTKTDENGLFPFPICIWALELNPRGWGGLQG